MSFIDYVQSFWGSSAPSTASPTGGMSGVGSFFTASSSSAASSGGSAQQLGSGVWPLSPQVREEMKKGTRYNMKVILRGTKSTGKSTLLARLTGHPLPVTYTPSMEIVASTMRLQGEQSAPQEGVKVDIWEVVEEGRQRAASSSSPNTTAKTARHIPSAQLHEALRVAADARLLDVYAGAHLTIFMIDPRQRASWDYAKQESLRVPPTCCILYALNFSDTTTPAAAAPFGTPTPAAASTVAITLEEVQAWTARVRRATTSVVHRILEGRQAAEDFSVRPMTAVLSALTGSGVMGVIRALHVASTLLRISTEEVRVLRLFGLMARQQAVSVSDDVSTPPPPTPPPLPARVDGGEEQSGALRRGSGEEAAGETALRSRSTTSGGNNHTPPPPTEKLVGSAAAAPSRTTNPTMLRMEHRPTLPAAPHNQLMQAGQHTGAAPSRALTEAEAMRLFLGSGGSSSSSSSGTSMPSSRSSSATTSERVPGHTGAAAKARSVLNTRHYPAGASTALPAFSQHEVPSRLPEKVVPSPLAFPGVDGTAIAAAAASSAGTPLEAAAQDVPSTEVKQEDVLVLVSTLVNDADAPEDAFFLEGDADETREDAPTGSERAAGPSAAASVKTPDYAAEADEESETAGVPTETLSTEVRRTDGMRARPLWTQRVVRQRSTVAPRTTHSDPPAHREEVSAILAQMTAALSADVPADGGVEVAGTANATEVAPREVTGGEETTKKKPSKSHRHSKDSTSARHEHARRRKHRGHRGEAECQQEENPTEVVEDDGSFDLVIV